MKLMVLDGNSIINRAFYGVKPLTTRDGLYTNAIFGFLNMLQRFIDEEQPEALCVAFDRREPTFRHEADANYKATRKGMPDELAQQMPVMKQVLCAMSIPCYEMVGYEADDLLGTISRRCEKRGWECVIVTGDRDSLQLITDRTRVKLVTSRMGQTSTTDMTPALFREQYGFNPIHMIDLKALMGDTSDNIPGVPGVGEKTAMALVQQYGDIDALYRCLPDIDAKPNVIRKLTEGEESARHSYWLATIVTDAPLAFDPAENLRRPFRPELYDLFLRLEFQKLIDRYHLRPHQETAEKPEYTTTVVPVETEEQARTLLEEWRRADHVALYAAADLTAISVHWDTGESTAQTAELWSGGYQGNWNALLGALLSGDIRKISHNVKDLMRTLLDGGLPAEGFVFDTALAAYLLDATAGGYDLPRLFVSYFNQELEKPAHLEPDAFSPLGDRAAAWASLHSYGAAIEALYGVLLPRLREQGMEKLYFDVELPLCRVLADMERSGFLVDGGALARFGADLSDTIRQLEECIYAAAGQQFNINSPKQLGKVLFEDLGLPHGKKTKTGWSTNADVLEKLKDQPLVADVLTYRQYAKLKSTYADGLLKVIDPDGRIRTSFQMTVTATGRLSSTEPNLQNIPTRTDLGSKMREMFVAAPGHVLVDADYSQIELRLLAHISGDEAMQQAFLSGEDFHTVTAARVFHVPQDQVTHQMRSRAKAVNFGIVYGISAFSLSQDIGVTVAEAKEYMERYFATYTGVRQYMEQVVSQARERGYVETLWHRRRALPELKSSNFNMRSFGERVALNMPIQGTAADIIKLAMVRVHRRLAAEGLEARLIMQVHDELIVECPDAEASRVEQLLQQEMQGVAELSVPLLAEAHTGHNWLAAKG